MDVLLIIIVYVVMMNLVSFALMGIDKYKAKKKAWRIPEATLFLFAIFGGSIGSTLGMFLFHHKTRHWYFLFGLPLILILQLVCIYLLWRSPLQFSIL
ncbi:MAG: DUF1294 domain-containing protein [Lachnospiraceae bacterium]|nr:DUF1294 domain-containing protein [Lachnospiraceae bacterium]